MSFSFDAPASTGSETTTTENTNVTGDNPVVETTVDNPVVDGADVQGNADSQSPENTGGEPAGAEEAKPETDQPEAEIPTEDPTFFFGDTQVEIDIPQDVTDSLAEKGIDASAVAAELYSKEGKFELSAETKQKLYDAFGKFSVDAYLNGLKAQNEGWVNNQAKQQEELERQTVERFTHVSKECGGEEGWSRLESFALETLGEDELEAFNAVMASGNQYLQQYAVRELEGRRKAVQGDDSVTLIEPTAPASDSSNAPLTAAAYIKAIADLSRFGHDKAGRAEAERQLDARRRAGMAKGL